MSAFALLYPSPSLARLADPLQLGGPAGSSATLPSIETVLEVAERRIERALRSVISRGGTQDGPVDERWYWVAQVLLDAQADGAGNDAWLSRANLANAWRSEQSTTVDAGDSALGDVLAVVRQTVNDPTSLGRVPSDLAAVLARLALGAPAVCALRALARAAGGLDNVADLALRDGAAHASWASRVS